TGCVLSTRIRLGALGRDESKDPIGQGTITQPVRSWPGARGGRGMKSRVILVEDQTIFREMLAALLDVQGHEVVAQLDRSATARDEIARKRPDLVVADVVLPDGNGLDLARWVRETQPKTRVMVVTAQEKASIVAEALRIRVNGIVMKNASLQELQQAVERVTNGGVYYCASSSQWIRESALNEHT